MDLVYKKMVDLFGEKLESMHSFILQRLRLKHTFHSYCLFASKGDMNCAGYSHFSYDIS